MKKPLPLAVALSLVAAACCAPPGKGGPGGSGAGSASSAKAKEAPVAVELGDVLNNYRENEVRGDSLYKGKTIATTGFVKNIGVVLGRPHLVLGLHSNPDQPEHPTLQCVFDKPNGEKLSAINKGARVRVTGTVSGLAIKSVTASDCDVVP